MFVQVETKRATPREARENPESCQSVTKVFVGGIPEEIEDDEIKSYFEQVDILGFRYGHYFGLRVRPKILRAFLGYVKFYGLA